MLGQQTNESHLELAHRKEISLHSSFCSFEIEEIAVDTVAVRILTDSHRPGVTDLHVSCKNLKRSTTKHFVASMGRAQSGLALQLAK